MSIDISKLTTEEIETYVKNNESLYKWWRSTGASLRNFIRRNRVDINNWIADNVGRA